VRQSTVVRSDRAHTFEVFVGGIAAWWPVDPFSFGAGRVAAVTFERRLGGRVFETWQDGSEHDWGEVRQWQPPETFTMSWNITGVPTEVQLWFRPLGPDRTRVDLEHRGWDALSVQQLRAACALPGGYEGGAFNAGWSRILARLVDAAEERTDG
jgi:hypothetical protein